jgi:hypothetical protein
MYKPQNAGRFLPAIPRPIVSWKNQAMNTTLVQATNTPTAT